ncbi:MAG TPA: amino acid permease [Bacteroidales bacterium]|jgi:amino acid transporter|nr:amino acid permease [Bacteroidales bacterium]HXK80857.1 amino acid permease [Bacteroidales bacterium]
MNENQKFGTAPVFFTAIATILGAILFLRFGFAVGTLGFWGVILLVFLGHLVTIPTALALSEIATNRRVEGGGEYFIVSRSFGLNIGSTIGIALYMSQAISVAFYVIAFTEAFEFFFVFMRENYSIELPRQVISMPIMGLLSLLIIKKGANLGVKALYIVVGILFLTIILFFLGSPDPEAELSSSILNFEMRNMKDFFIVFAIVFPAFTGMTAGVGLSGDLKKPGKSIPLGTISATFIGMIVYIFIAWKLASSASVDDLLNNQFVMGKIALGGVIMVPIGLAASTISSALGSVMVAPRTLQALCKDSIFPSKKLNIFLAKERQKDKEPINASIITCLIAFGFVAIGDINAVAEIISMFFMLTYGSLCLISFLNHFGSSPSYRPSFKSKWWLSLIGFIVSVWVMFKINTTYALAAFILLTLIYIYINYYHKNRRGLSSIFVNTVFQLNRKLHLFVQSKTKSSRFTDWRPSIICVSKYSFERKNALRLLDWISNTYGFSTYLHKVEGYFSSETAEIAKQEQDKLLQEIKEYDSVFIDTIISPSYTTAIAQAIQLPGVSGLENNIVLFEFDKNDLEEQAKAVDNFNLVKSGNFDIMFLASGKNKINYKGGIHIWINVTDNENINLMVMLSFIILNHKDWRKANIKVFVIIKKDETETFKESFIETVNSGRIPIMLENIEFIIQDENTSTKSLMHKNSKDAGLIITGLREEILKHKGIDVFTKCEELTDTLFVYSKRNIPIE